MYRLYSALTTSRNRMPPTVLTYTTRINSLQHRITPLPLCTTHSPFQPNNEISEIEKKNAIFYQYIVRKINGLISNHKP